MSGILPEKAGSFETEHLVPKQGVSITSILNLELMRAGRLRCLGPGY
jgi:hypothetical protein